MDQRAGLIVFAKAPEPGQVKTRLVAELGELAAAELYKRLVLHILSAVSVPPLKYDIELWCSPDTSHAFFHALQQRFAVPLRCQQGTDLGERMGHAVRDVLSRGVPAIIIGTDCPLMNRETVELMTDKLKQHDAVVIPAEDGGYVLLGMNRFDPALFHAIPWGSADVMTCTRSVFKKSGWSVYEHETFWDVDRPEDMERLKTFELVQG